MKLKKNIRVILKWMSYGIFLLVIVAISLEIVYRNYWLNFYKAEFSYEDYKLNPTRKNILVIGDSFTAHPDNYVNLLRDSLQDFNIIKAGVPGTTILHHKVYFDFLIKKYAPSFVIYQTYTGNDIFEYRHPRQGNSLSLLRNSYWWLSERMLVLSLINKRLKFLFSKKDDPALIRQLQNQEFSPSIYRPRDKLLFSIEPDHINNIINMNNKRRTDVDAYFNELIEMLIKPGNSFSSLIIVVPHCIQVNDVYEKRMTKLGASPLQKNSHQNNSYPYIEILRKKAENHNIKIYDALGDFKKYGDLNLYLNNDPHLSNQGQKYLGSMVYRFIKNQNIVQSIK